MKLGIVAKIVYFLFVFFITIFLASCGVNETTSWEIEDGKLTISGDGSIGNFCSGFDLNEGNFAPEGNYEIPWKGQIFDTVVLDAGITEISGHSFGGFESLEKVVINGNNVSVRHAAFYECINLKEIENTENISRIFTHAFYGCKSLTSLHFGNNLSVLENDAFKNCTSLEEVSISEDNPNFTSLDGVVYTKDMSTLIYYPSGKRDEIFVIPKETEQIDYRAICDNPFVKMFVFEGESIPSLHLEDILSCKQLTYIKISSSVTQIEDALWTSNFTIICEEGSAAHQYAKENNISFRIE